MMHRSFLSVFLALAAGSTGAAAQQYRPQDPYFNPAVGGGYHQPAPGGRPVSPAPRSTGIAPAQYAADELSLGNSDVVWIPPRPTAADASRAVADQLRQQYRGPSEGGLPSPHVSLESRAAYRPLPAAEVSSPVFMPATNDGPPAEFSRYRQSPRYEQPLMQDPAPGHFPDQRPGSAPDWPTPAPAPAFGHPRATGPGVAHGGPSHGPGMGPYEGHGGYGMEPGLGSGGQLRRGSAGNYGYDCGVGDCGVGDYATDSDCYGGSPMARGWNRGCRDMYTIVGARWLNMRRDGADYKSLSYESPMPSMTLLVEDANIGYQSGIEVFFVRQDQNGRGWEGRYWGLPSQAASETLGNMPVTQLTGLGMVDIGPWGNVAGLYNIADYHQVTRSSELHSFELNLINHASTCGTGKWLYRGVLGARVIRFRDRLDYSAYSASNFGFNFDQITYGLLTRNTFVGAQAGGSGEYCVTNKLRLAAGATAGVGQVFLDADQVIETSTGVRAFHPGGGSFSYMNASNDLSVFGELDLRAYYHVSQNWRLSCGYRLLGISGFALAHHQIPSAFSHVAELNSVKRDGGLILHGLTLGAEFSY